jgi:cytochrome c-type protein NapB
MMEEIMRKILAIILSTAFLGTGLGFVAQAQVVTLRGENALDAAAEKFGRRRQTTVDGSFDRSWKQQPPSIPHKVNKDEITLQVNTCLRCHSAENFKKEKAPKIGDTHFIAADGSKSDKMDMRRYFCNQCHTPQLDVDPLVENTFKTVKQ